FPEAKYEQPDDAHRQFGVPAVRIGSIVSVPMLITDGRDPAREAVNGLCQRSVRAGEPAGLASSLQLVAELATGVSEMLEQHLERSTSVCNGIGCLPGIQLG